MRCEPYRGMTLAEVEQRVMPALLSGLHVIMNAKFEGREVPVAAAFWAFVSPEVDARLSDPNTAQAPLKPEEWRSGDIARLIDCVGDGKQVGWVKPALHSRLLRPAASWRAKPNTSRGHVPHLTRAGRKR